MFYLYHGIVFILPTAVVCMKMDSTFAQPVLLEEVVQQTDDSVGTFGMEHSFVDEVVGL